MGLAVSAALGLLAAAAPVATAAVSNAVTPGPLRVDVTFQSIGLYWPISDDANRNSSLTLEYRKVGESAWRAGAPAMKAEPTTIVDGAPLGLHHLAASALLVDPGTAYEVRGTIADADGGGTTQVLTATTRTEPRASASGRHRAVVPGAGGGDGTAGNPFRGLQTAATAAVPGDIFDVAAGTYAPFAVTASGTAADPIVFRGVEGGGSVVDGANTDRGVVTIGSIATSGAHVIVESLTIQNGHWGIDADSTHDITIRGNVIRDVDFGIVNRRDSGVEHDQTIVDNRVVGRMVWPGTGIPEEQGMELRGDGNVVGYNTVDHFGDCISLQPGTGTSYGNDVVGNDVSFCVDDGIQTDFQVANVRVWRNRATNTRMGVSIQPLRGGPAYIFRNELLNMESNPIKMNNNPSGFVVFHNTSVKTGPGLYDPAEVWRNAIFRNNLMLGTGYAFEFTTVADEGFRDFDFDAWGSARAGTVGDPWFKWDGVRYAALADLQGAGVETHGVAAGFADVVDASLPASWDQAVAPGSRDLRLAPGAPEVNRGAVLANGNEGFVTDGQPDMGAFEAGQGPPAYGPRTGNAVTPPAGAPARFVSFGPVRQFDTRRGDQGGRHPGGRATRVYTLPSVPVGATAVTMNVTAVDPAAGGYLSVFPCKGAVPATSSLNYQPDRGATPNQVTVAVSGGQVCVLSQQDVDLVIDVAGWWLPAGDSEFGADQQRLWDTRTQGGGAAGSVLVLDLATLSAGRPDVTGVSVNLTTTDSTGAGFLTGYDCDTARPLASNVNFTRGITTANHATLALRSSSRRLCVYASNATDIVVDLTGWWVTGSGQRTLRTLAVPDRSLDTREPGARTGRLVPGGTVTIHPPLARSLFVNVTADAAIGPGYIAVFPCSVGWQGTSTVNFRPGVPVANAALVDATSGVCARSNTSVELIFDVFGEATGA